jgi:hypothetical protein
MSTSAGQRAWRLPAYAVGLVAGLVLAVINIATRDWLGLAAMCLLTYVSSFGLWDALRSRGAERGDFPSSGAPVARDRIASQAAPSEEAESWADPS